MNDKLIIKVFHILTICLQAQVLCLLNTCAYNCCKRIYFSSPVIHVFIYPPLFI